MSDSIRRKWSSQHIGRALAQDSGALVVASAMLQPSYSEGGMFALTAVDDSPNVTAPDDDRLICATEDDPTRTLDCVALYPVYTGAAGNTVFGVWVRSGLTGATDPDWILLRQVTFTGSNDVETIVNVGNRTVFIQAVSGVVAAPVNLYVAVA
ncbi:MAG: hypothetical protein WC262_09815 [Bacteroidales bacterium]|jgi:hypothetical protein